MSTLTASVEIRAPSGQEEGTRSQVLRWLKAVGEPVAEHEPLIELETDKVTVEVASPGAGVLAEILKQEQEEVAPGELLGRIGPVAAIAQQTDTASRNPAAQSTSARNTAAPVRADAVASGSRSSAAARQLSPAVRRLLAEHSLDAASIQGTGEGGRI